MADYRKRLVDMTEEERAEVAPGAPQFSDDYENVDDPLSVQMMEAGLDFTPFGVVKGVSDIKDELSKDDPNYLKALGMGAVEAAGIIPGAAPVLKGMVKGSFKTSKGSVYDVFDDNTTVRNRAERGDSESVGIQPRSGKTIYMTREGIDELGPLFQNTEIPVQFVPVEGDKAKLVYTQDYGPRKAGMDASPEVPYTLDPEVGLHPVEILDSRNTNSRNIHFGNDITVVESNVPSTKGTNKQVYKADAVVDPVLEADDIITEWEKGNISNNELRSQMRDKGFDIRTKRIGPKMTGVELEVLDSRTGKIDTWDKIPTSFNKGGAVMNNRDSQMEMLFDEGGIADDGMNADPVSGNEIPPGSMASEVRDDIPAQLSEGEYVVPADVVRYYGVKFFEDLRTEAKTGFNAMEANGRIGGEPMGMEVVEPQDDLDIMFDDSDFEVTDGPDGYAEGGVVTPTDFGVRVFETVEMREYVNAQGNTISIMFFNGMPMSAIPEGYTYVNPEPDTATTGGAVTTAADVPSSSDDGPPVVPSSTVEPTNYKELTPSELQALVVDQRSITQDVIAGIGGVVNPVLGIAMKIGMWHTSRQVTKELERRIADPENADLKDKYAELLEYHESDTDSYYNRIMDTIEGKERDKLPFDIEAADPAAINAAIEEGLAAEEGYAPDDFEGLTTGEVVPLGALEPVAAGFTPSPDPIAGEGVSTDFPFTYIPYGDEKFNTAGQGDSPTPLTDAFGTGNIYTAGSDAAGVADRKRINDEREAKRTKRINNALERAKAYAAKKRQERQREIDSLEAQISARGSIDRDRSGDDSRDAMDRAREASNRNKAKGLGAQTKKGSTAGSKSGYFD